MKRNNKVKIKDTYRQNNGKEGEHAIYYTLSGLTSFTTPGFYAGKEVCQKEIANKEKGPSFFAPIQIFTPHLVKLKKKGFGK